MDQPVRPRLSGLVKEGFVIFLGVLVALVADDWRGNRAEREEAQASLQVITADLARDSLTLEEVSESARQHELSAGWLFNHWDGATPPSDSLGDALLALHDAPLLSFSRAGYDGLRAANRLDLLEDDELRAMLTSYYEVDQPLVRAYYEIVYERREGLLLALAPHVAFRTYPPEPASLGLRGTWGELNADFSLHTRLRRYGGSQTSVALQVDALQERMGALRELVRSSVGR